MDTYGAKIKMAIGLLIVAVVLVLLSLNSQAAAAPPSVVSYQGKVLQNGVSASTSLDMTFKLFNTSTGGIELYSYTETIIPSSGLFSALLGDSLINPLDPKIFRDNSDLYLEVVIEGETLYPRKRIVTVPYAFNARYLDGYGVSLTPTNTNYIPVADSDGGFTFGNVTTTGDLYVSGTVRAGQICDKDGNNCYVPSAVLSISDVTTTPVTSTGNFVTGTIYKGYQAANMICDYYYPGYHFCFSGEIISFIRLNDFDKFASLPQAWIAEGPPGYTAPVNDCIGYKTSAMSSLGSFWEFSMEGGGQGWLSNCEVGKAIACCK